MHLLGEVCGIYNLAVSAKHVHLRPRHKPTDSSVARVQELYTRRIKRARKYMQTHGTRSI